MASNVLESPTTPSRTSLHLIRCKFTNLISSLGKTNKKLERATSLKHQNPQLLRQFRAHDYQAYTGLKQNILNTFSLPNSKLHQEIFVLNKNLDRNQTQKVEKTMEKLSIKQKSKQNSLDNINTQFISKMYIIEKSKEKRKELMMAARKERKGKEEGKDVFFSYQRDDIREFERSWSLRNRDNAKYFKIPQTRRKDSESMSGKKPYRQVQSLRSSREMGSKSPSQKHPIVSIFDDESSKMLRIYKNSRMVDLVETQPYEVYDDEIELDEPLLPGIDIGRIRRKYEKLRSNLHLVQVGSEQLR